MYFTFYTTRKDQKQITFQDILLNPYMKLPEINYRLTKVTQDVDEQYALKYFNHTDQTLANITEDMIVRNKETFTMNTSEHYSHFEIKKKSDPSKKRPIDAPDLMLKNAQGILKTYIEDQLKALPHKAAHAYVENRSTVTAMKMHQKNESKWFLQLDLSNFFNSINEDFMRKMLSQVYPFPFIPVPIFDSIINLSLLENEMPQGSVLSPTLSNMVMVPIDHKITETLHNYEHHHYVYTRYADDITISCKEKFDKNEILDIIKSIFKEFEAPLQINESKTRYGSTAGKNFHLGIILNNHGKNKSSEMSIGHEKNKRFRAMLFNFCTTGEEWDKHDVQKMLGLISYYKSIEKPFIERTIQKYNSKFNIDIMAKAKQLIK